MSGTGQLPELDSLRSQLADVAQELAERDRTLQEQATHHDRELQDLREQAVLLRAIVEGTAAETGDDFLTSLVTQLTSTLQVHYALVGRITPDQPRSIRTIAVSAGGIVVDNFEYPLAQTPCEAALAQPFTCFAHHVQNTFPRFTRWVEWGVDSYCGVPIRTKGGAVIGVLAVMDRKPLPHTDWLPSLLTVFAARAGAELQREQAEEAKLEAERRLRFTQCAVDHAVDGVLWADDSRQFVYANDAACRSLGYSREELLGLRIADIAPHHDPDRFQRRLDAIKQGGAATYESVHRRKDGTEFPVEISVTYLEHEGKDYTCGIIRDITERKRVEQEQLQALTDLQNIMETVPDIMFTLDANGNLMRWNSRLAFVTEYEPEELLNKSALAFVPVEEQTQTAAAIQRAFTEGYAELDGHLLTKSDRTIPYHWTGATLKDAAGRVIGITGIGRDVSEQKQAQVELAHRRRHLVKAQALAHLGSCEWNIESGEIVWSDEHYRIFGHEPRAITVTYDTFLAALLPDDHDRVLAAMNEALLGKAPYDIECRIVRPTGEIRTIHCRADLTRDHSGHPVMMSGTVLDVTERHQIEAALRASEERWQLAIQGSNDGIWDWNLQSGDIFFSSQWKAMRGFADQEIRHHIDEWRSRIHPDDLDRVLQSLEAYLNRQRPEFREEYRVQRKDGSFMWILDRGVALWDDDGTPVRMAGSEKDISERKHHQQLLAAERRILEMISTDAPLTEVLSSICLMIQNLSAEARCSILLLDQDGLHLRHGAAPALPEAYIQAINGSRIGPSAGSCGTAAFLGRQVIVTNIAQDPLWADYRTLALSHGLQACWSTPIVSKAGTVLGTFALYYPTPQQPSEAELRLLEQATHLADIAIERTRAADALRQSVSRFDLAVQGSRDGLWYAERVSDNLFAPQNPMYYSPRMKEIMGVADDPASDVLATWLSLVHPDDLPRVLQALTEHLEHRNPYDVEYRIIQHGTGCVRWIGAKGQAVWDPTGQPIRMAGSFSDITHRKQAEDALRRSKAQLCDILENNPAVVYTRQTGEGWPHTFITPNIYQLLGYTSIDILSRPELWDSLMHPDDLAELMAQYLPSLLRTGVRTFVTRLRHRDGHYRWVENQARLSHLHDGPLLMVGTMTDVTERMRAEEALRESEARNRSILESVLDAVISIDDRGVIIGWNPQAEVLFGYAAEEVLGLPLDETIIPARYRQAHAHGVNRILQSGHGTPIKRRFEFSALHRNGLEFPVEFAIASTQIGGRPTFSAFIRNITERKQAEEALHASEERFRAAYDNASVGISICDLTGRLQEVNQALCEILGYSQQELLAKDFQSLTHPDDLPGNLDRIRGLLTGAVAHEVFEKRYIRNDGGTVWTQVGLSVIRSQDETPSHLLAMVQDITERKQAEEAVRESERRLRQAVLAGDIGIFDHDHQDDTIYWSPEQRRIYGWNAEEPVTLAKYLAHVYEEDREWITESVRRAHDPAGDGRFDVEHRIIDRHGTLRWLNTKSVTFFEGDGPARRKVRTVGAVADITERKRAEEVVTRSYDLMKSFVEHTPAAVAMLDNDLRYVAVSRRWLQDYRLGDQDLIGRHHYEIFPEIKDKQEWHAIHQRCLTGAVERREEDRFVRADGSEDWLRWEVRPWQDVTGRIGGIIMFTEVVTERKRAEKALRETNSMLQALIETSPLAIIGLDQDGTHVTRWNPAAERIFGWRADEVLGHPLPYIPAEDQARSLAMWEEATQTGVLTGRELRRLRKDGSLIDMALWSTALKDAQGTVTGTFSFIADITDRKRTEEALKRSERQLRTVLDTLPIGVWFTDDQGHVLYGNPVGQRIWADAARVGLPQPGGDTLWWETLEKAESPHRWAVGTVIARGHDMPNEMLELETSTGSRRTIRNSAVAVKDDAGTILGAIVLNEDITDRVRAEQALRQEHALVMAVMDAAIDIIFVKDLEGRYIHMNRAGAHTLGMAVEEVIGWNDYALWPSDLAASCRLADRHVLGTGESITVEETSVSDGTTTIYLTTKAPYRDPEGRIIGIIGVARDITEQKRAEEALRSSEERFAKAFRSSPYPIGITEMDTGYCIDVNDACLELFGFRRDEVIGSTTLLLGIWPDPKKREQLIEQLQSGRPVRNLDMSFRTHSGELHHMLMSSDFIELNGKRCLITVGNDITEQKRAEQNLQRSHAFIRQIIDTDPNFIFAKDRDGRFTLVNKAVAEAYGTTVDALIGKTDADFNGNVEEVAFFLSKDRDVLEHLQDQFIPEERITDANGAVRWLQTVKRPILDESGKATMVLGASTDITERKQMEEALRQRERDLRAAIEERERISQDLHDGILQSLYAVGLGLEACKPLMTQRHYKKAVATMGEAIGQLNHVMREIRNFIAGLESQVLQGSTFPAALQEMVHTLGATHSLRCAVDLDEAVASHISTEQALHLLNIVREALSNSLRHARATKATVSLKPLSRSLRLSISDNGIGFDPASISGVGHGLTNMAARARKVGGRFTIRAAPRKGTRIIIDLPKENIHA